jgi:hypothetical protein
MPTDNEKAIRAEAWARALMGIIPEHALQQSFRVAFHKQASGFPVSAYDLKNAYEAIRNGAADQRQDAAKHTLANCPDCHGTGMKYVDVNGTQSGMVKCRHASMEIE